MKNPRITQTLMAGILGSFGLLDAPKSSNASHSVMQRPLYAFAVSIISSFFLHTSAGVGKATQEIEVKVVINNSCENEVKWSPKKLKTNLI